MTRSDFLKIFTAAPIGFIFGVKSNIEEIPNIHLSSNIKIRHEYVSSDMVVMRMENDNHIWFIYNYSDSSMKFLEFDKNMKLLGKWVDNGNDKLIKV